MAAEFRRDSWLIAPYAAWMALMALLPQTAWAYAVRGGATALLLTCGAVFTPAWRRPRFGALPLAAGVAAGVAVFAVWIAPDILFGTGATVAAADSPYSPEVCGLGLTLLKLAASAFVIPAAEELFFRRWLVDFAGFWWMVALFAVEHGDRWHVGALAGIGYGLLAKRYGLLSAIVAHSVTNLVLGLYVILANQWQYW